MRIISSNGRHDVTIQKSRFWCFLFRVQTESQAREAIAAHRRTFWDASHNCTAYVVGTQGPLRRSNDDGEPAGTAGAPMLEVLTGRELTNTLAIVTRYFGGVKLGAGGLVRAYSTSVAQAVESVGTHLLRPLHRVSIEADYAIGPVIESLLRSGAAIVIDVHWGSSMRFDVATDDVEGLESQLRSLSSGSVDLEVTGQYMAEVPESPAA
ncbi:IMPACT family protein [Natronoglycomyces albus]|uniref:YigZ family protein n=1 Tax=Natronoglycomyces albus TaxID=2811108 RepID=A0A895XX75_9ACTN|nr:YigZ family protein [Natronoglycomyces albus]QSB06820.1 YigZ family protein [Natronoglycomyces albus]